ncbi:hypothetical protein ES319_A05G076700v1 [Gossypium barbadense]|uniref:YqgF/RNase H-like domain-containing protein n=1 Tax=Gossypium barbadense TaxID=3634 RepID=A0A5J5VL87_GOSBA|nr:hypothetical protein ES319_A05G076700v1 [Gossypium barbadense]
MEIQLLPWTHCMTSLSSKLYKPLLYSSSSKLVPFSSSSLSSSSTRVSSSNSLKLCAAPLEAGWLDSLSCPSPHAAADDPTRPNADSTWVIGIDPDLSGALALLKSDSSGSSAQVFDSPHLPVQVGNRVRKRLDARSIVRLLQSLEAPIGLVERRIWVWIMDRDTSCLRVFCSSSVIFVRGRESLNSLELALQRMIVGDLHQLCFPH